MQYSYDQWASGPKERTSIAEAPEQGGFPFAEELKALEADLSLGFEEGWQAYRQHQENQPASVSPAVWQALHEAPLAPHDEASGDHWDDLARQVADHVMAHIHENPLQAELEQLHAQVGDYYQDNRALQEQVQHLMAENDQLRHTLTRAELELAHFRPLLGNLFLRL